MAVIMAAVAIDRVTVDRISVIGRSIIVRVRITDRIGIAVIAIGRIISPVMPVIVMVMSVISMMPVMVVRSLGRRSDEDRRGAGQQEYGSRHDESSFEMSARMPVPTGPH
jgi:hypothetical protein